MQKSIFPVMMMLSKTKAVFAKILGLSLIVIAGFLTFTESSAQTTSPNAKAIAVGELMQEADLNKPGNVTARVSRLASQEAQGALNMFLHGAVKITEGEGGEPSVKLEWFGLSSDVNGSDTVSLGPALETAHQVTDIAIAKGTELSVAGDISSLARAALTITQNAEAPKEEENDDKEDQPAVASSGGSTTQSGSGGAIDRTEAKLPEMNAVRATDTIETVINNDAYGTTTDGCTPEMSEDGTYMHILEKPTKNGESDGECAPGIDTAPILFTYIGCGYEKDLTPDVMKSYAQRMSYYIYGGSSTPVDTECTSVKDIGYPILESDKGCKVVPDLRPGYMVAKQYTALVFTGRENEPNDVEGCKSRTGPEFPITTEICGLRDDFEGKKTYEQEIATYVAEDGLKRNIGDCTDTTRYYVHDFDTSVCQPFADYSSNKLFEQYRVKIDISASLGFDEYRTNTCKPFADALTDLQETQIGCESIHFDYVDASFGAKRIVRTDTGALVRECRESDISYPHFYEAEGWLTDDNNLKATPKEATYINLPSPAGKTLVAAAVVRTGAASETYLLSSTTYENGTTEYIPGSCNKYVKQNKMEHWQRPDGTTFTRQNGFGSSISDGDACSKSISPNWNKVANGATTKACTATRWNSQGDGQMECYMWRFTCSATYEGTMTLTRDDGEIISTSQHRHGYSKTIGQSGYHAQWTGGECPATAPYVQQWGINLGLL